ncbi:MAG: hypothetical protein B6D79_08580 [gamma proteobacterium symbiont of Ctena orbiculata]|nr:MAG: hypothetical protein B6D79_08580 [gamma proteobacterium symbiont of Ctena orbiculata]
MLINTVIAGVRQTKLRKSINYRCDSPELKRFMVILIEPAGPADLYSARIKACNRGQRPLQYLQSNRGGSNMAGV